MVSRTQRSIGTLVAAALVLILILTLEASPAAGATSKACRVTNMDTGRAYASLQAAVDAARKGARLTVRGTCRGSTVIDKSLTIEGHRTKRSGQPTLDGGGSSRPVAVMGDIWPPDEPDRQRLWRPTVTIRSLTIRNGRGRPSIYDGMSDGGSVGGGIWNNGDLKLRDVVVRDNRAANTGGGIYNAFHGRLRLNGTTRIVGNTAAWGGGGGIGCWYCRVVLNDSSSVRGNTARSRGCGGGVNLGYGGLYMNDASSIRGNTATLGGGVCDYSGYIVLNDASSIRHNTANLSGGGIFDSWSKWEEEGGPGEIELNDSSSITGNRAVSGEGQQGCGRRSSVRYRGSWGGGMWIDRYSHLTMSGSSVITGNQAACGGGGLAKSSTTRTIDTLVGVSCAPETLANIYGNAPDDCLLESPSQTHR